MSANCHGKAIHTNSLWTVSAHKAWLPTQIGMTMFSGIKSRLAKNGYFLMSCCVFEPNREDTKTRIVDSTTGKVYTRFDQDALWDSDTETCYSPFQLDPFSPNVGPEDYEGTICVNGTWYIHQRCYRTPENLRLELERHGFTVLEQSGEVTENAICVHQGACLTISYTQHP